MHGLSIFSVFETDNRYSELPQEKAAAPKKEEDDTFNIAMRFVTHVIHRHKPVRAGPVVAQRRPVTAGSKSCLRAGGLYHPDGGGWGGFEGHGPSALDGTVLPCPAVPVAGGSPLPWTRGSGSNPSLFVSPRPVPVPPSCSSGCARERPDRQGQVPAEDGVSRAAGTRRRFLSGRGERGLAALSPGSGGWRGAAALSLGSQPPRRRGSLAGRGGRWRLGRGSPFLAFPTSPLTAGDLRRSPGRPARGEGLRPWPSAGRLWPCPAAGRPAELGARPSPVGAGGWLRGVPEAGDASQGWAWGRQKGREPRPAGRRPALPTAGGAAGAGPGRLGAPPAGEGSGEAAAAGGCCGGRGSVLRPSLPEPVPGARSCDSHLVWSCLPFLGWVTS